jgi:triphosphoribosyl-dephospho-CoA synthetase
MKGKKKLVADKDLSAEELIKKYGTKSAAIRRLAHQGMPTAEIARKMEIIYQHARNVLKRPLKRQMQRK